MVIQFCAYAKNGIVYFSWVSLWCVDYIRMKFKGNDIHATIWMNLENIMSGKASCREAKYHIISSYLESKVNKEFPGTERSFFS